MNRIILILAGALMVACGSMNGYHDAQQAAYAKMLTKSEQSEINQKGVRPQDKPVAVKELPVEDQALIKKHKINL